MNEECKKCRFAAVCIPLGPREFYKEHVYRCHECDNLTVRRLKTAAPWRNPCSHMKRVAKVKYPPKWHACIECEFAKQDMIATANNTAMRLAT